eukprot:5137886-Amphidinium_carterae.1
MLSKSVRVVHAYNPEPPVLTAVLLKTEGIIGVLSWRFFGGECQLCSESAAPPPRAQGRGCFKNSS